jgi:hypothetical protein
VSNGPLQNAPGRAAAQQIPSPVRGAVQRNAPLAAPRGRSGLRAARSEQASSAMAVRVSGVRGSHSARPGPTARVPGVVRPPPAGAVPTGAKGPFRG